MELLMICFFTLFFLISIIGIIIRLISISTKRNVASIELYDDGSFSTNLNNVYVGRLADATVRSSVRFHKSLYKTKDDYEQYRNNIRELNLP
ncbi:hypothetical protein AALB52_26150 [Lachnospiraceae bacterium 38-14]|uniref:hypothetical protein n=1 Tax=Roseburia sp. 1XD42-69 TaxID=2320088 RepID=UPI000EA0D4A1|nr:hypothetical protein [Roseburia sp. 1XD42-69]RKJ60166.1 hypothetical protein D7Y06_24690 [Roseburia sp. 1XD42-69]